MKVSTDRALIREVLTRAIEKIYPTAAALEKELLSGRRLRLYLGIDPTSTHLHIGHAASLWILRRFQDLGHEIILLAVDFTARIGDPSDKLAARQPLTEEAIEQNLRTFKTQAGKIVRFDGPNPARLEHNAAWHDKMSFRELIKLAQQFTVQQMVERDMFQTRLKAGKPIGLHEFLYPLMQGYDSVAMDVDVEVGGSDQTFNMLAGRTLMKSLKGKEKFVVANRLLVDAASGKKLSKTEGSLVNLDDAPQDIFGRVMAMPDEMMPHVAELSTRMPMEKIQKLGKMKNPRDAKLILAEAVVSLYHSPAAAQKAREEWVRVFSKKETPEEIQELPSTPRGTAILEEIRISGVSSKSETMRLLRQGAIKINDSVEKNAERKTQDGDILKVGKKKYFRIRQK